MAVQNIAVVNGKPSVYGDALTAIAQGHHETESYEDGYLEDGTAYCKITRKGRTIYREFSVEMAKRAGLWGRNTWAQYPERMLLWRARGWAIRDAFADVLMGLWSVEEAVDGPVSVEDKDVTPDESEAEIPKNKKAKSKADKIKSKVKQPEKNTANGEEEDDIRLTPPEPIDNEEVYFPGEEDEEDQGFR